MKTIAIIGGGITGVSTAYYLQKFMQDHHLDLQVQLIEANETLGGKIRTIRDGEFIMEAGADSIVARKMNTDSLIDELDLREKLVYNATGKSFLYTDGSLKQIPADTVFGIPLSLESLAGSELVSAEGKVEALKDFYTQNDRFTKDDSVGQFLEAFLGKELVERQIAPVLSGVYSGELHDLTIASTLPYLLDYKNQYGSIIQGLSENRQAFQGSGDKKFFSFQSGVSELVELLTSRITQVDIRKGVKAERIVKKGERYEIQFEGHASVNADYVVLSVPHMAAQRLLLDSELDQSFNRFITSSLISIYLGYEISDDQLPMDGTGFIVAGGSGLTCNACTWTSRKWAHTSKKSHLLVRLFYKSSIPDFESLRQFPELELLKIAVRDVEASLGITANPVSHEVTKWMDAMPNYHISHHKLVKSLESTMANRYPRIYLAGCSYYGVGIPDCIENGKQTAERIANHMLM